MPKRNLAARAGHWSARHRKTAIFGWLAFVVIAFVLGGAIGTNSLKGEDTGNGGAQVAGKAIAKADVPSPYDKGNEGQISKDESGALVTFSIQGDSDATETRVDTTLAATKAAQ